MPINAAQHPLRFGFDLDNTLINYEGACRRLCTDRGIKPTADENVRAALKRFCDTLPDGNAEWTRIQGWLYAEGLAFAEPFPGALECLRTLKGLGAHLYIVSHKSYFPALGSPKSLHTAATDWLKQYGIIDWAEGVFLEVSMADKLRRIAALNCLWFVDDLDVVLGAADFPKAVNRLQFCPDNNTLDKPWKVATSWKEITDTLDQAATEQLSKVRQLRIQTLEQPAHNPNDAVSTGLPLMPESVAAWLKDYSHGGFERIRQLGGAGNNSVYRVYFSDEPPLIVKFYKNTGNDQCERLDREWAFTSLIHSATDFAVPKPLIREHATGIAVFTSLKGRGIPTEQEVPVHYWEQCLKFLQQIQVVSGAIDNSPLPYAREALTSLQAYLGNLQKKRDYWLKQALEGTVDSESALWIQNDLEGMYQTVAEAIISHPSFKDPFPLKEFILSPSDFGLHNALILDNDQLGFVDFEYAGWDHPLKVYFDFIHQPRIPVPSTQIPVIEQWFANNFNCPLNTPIAHLFRKAVGLNWCYIMMQHQGVTDTVKARL